MHPSGPCQDCRCGASGRWLSRRTLLGGGLAIAGIACVPATPSRAQDASIPQAAIQRLVAGNQRFVEQRMTSFDEDLDLLKRRSVGGQAPFAALLSCANSRVPVELIFDASIGQLFVTRTAGNVAAGDIIASLEYAAAVLGTTAILVLGHSGCGAVKAAIGGAEVPGQISGLFPYLQPAVDAAGPDVEATVKSNARIQAKLLAEASPVLRGRVKQGELLVAAAYYDLGSGQVSML